MLLSELWYPRQQFPDVGQAAHLQKRLLVLGLTSLAHLCETGQIPPCMSSLIPLSALKTIYFSQWPINQQLSFFFFFFFLF